MSDTYSVEVLARIQAFVPVGGNWRPLDDLLCQLWIQPATLEWLPTLFSVFERFPEDDGAGVLWSIVHGLEATDLNYGPALKASLLRRPSQMAKIMLDRLERANAG